MASPGYSLFETALGPCGIAWSERGIVALHLPESTPRETEARLSAYGPSLAPPPVVRAVMDRVQRHLDGAPESFADVVVDLASSSPFACSVYERAREILPGKTCSYGDLAVAVGRPGGARAVGQALGRNPVVLIIPCHRVLGHRGAPGGFSAHGGIDTKRHLLALEGVVLDHQPVRRETRSLFHGDALERAVAALRRRDARMGRIVEQVGACTLGSGRVTEEGARKDSFGALCEAVLYQQLAGRAAAAIAARFRGAFGQRYPSPPELHVADPELVRAVGISGAKLATLKTLAAAVVEGRLELARLEAEPDAEISRQLTALRGIGRWTVEMFLMFHLGRPDVWPASDLGIRKAVARLQGREELPAPQEVEDAGRRWAPYRTVAAWYLWRSLGTVTID